MDNNKLTETNILNELSFRLRAPLSNIIGFSNALLKTERPEMEKEFLEAISNSGKLILKIIEDKLGKDSISNEPSAKSGEEQLGLLHFKEIQQLNILLVEDDILNIKLIGHLFKDYGLKADVATNGTEAIEKMLASSYDLILMDIEMQEMNGYDTTLYIRETLKSKVPVIALTAHATSMEKEKALFVGMNGYITKPVDMGRLLEIIYYSITPQSAKETVVNNPVTDFTYLQETMQGKRDAIKEMLDYVLIQVPVYLAELNNAVNKLEYESIAKLSHKIKSAVSLMGAGMLGPILNEMEINGKNNSAGDEIKRLNSNLNSICIQALKEVKKERLKYW